MAKGNFRYVINFVDDFTGTCFVYFLKQKSDATTALEKFLCDIAPYGKVNYVTTRFRTDNGGEYIAKDFEKTLIANNIRHEFSAPYSPHQNGTAERNWRSLFEIARGMIIGSDLPQSLWTYAVMAATHIRNRMYCQRIKDTPYHLLTGKKPNISKLHVFGSVCFAYCHDDKKKLDPRSRRGIFVGYDKYSPSYLIFSPDTKKVMKYGTVKFTERFENDINISPIQTYSSNLLPTCNTNPFDELISFYNNASNDMVTQHQETINDEITPVITVENNPIKSETNDETPLLQNQPALDVTEENNIILSFGLMTSFSPQTQLNYFRRLKIY